MNGLFRNVWIEWMIIDCVETELHVFSSIILYYPPSTLLQIVTKDMDDQDKTLYMSFAKNRGDRLGINHLASNWGEKCKIVCIKKQVCRHMASSQYTIQ